MYRSVASLVASLSEDEKKELTTIASQYVRIHLVDNYHRETCGNFNLNNIAQYVKRLFDQISGGSADESTQLTRELFFRRQCFDLVHAFHNAVSQSRISSLPTISFHADYFQVNPETWTADSLPLICEISPVTVPTSAAAEAHINSFMVKAADRKYKAPLETEQWLKERGVSPENIATIRMRRAISVHDIRDLVMNIRKMHSRVYTLYRKNLITWRSPYILSAFGANNIAQMPSIDEFEVSVLCQEVNREMAVLLAFIPGNIFYRPDIQDDLDEYPYQKIFDHTAMYVMTPYVYDRLCMISNARNKIIYRNSPLNGIALFDRFANLAYTSVSSFHHSEWDYENDFFIPVHRPVKTSLVNKGIKIGKIAADEFQSNLTSESQTNIYFALQ